VGEHEGRQFLVMELLEGRTLKQYIDGQALSVKQILTLELRSPVRCKLPMERNHSSGSQARQCFCHGTRRDQSAGLWAGKITPANRPRCNSFTGIDRTLTVLGTLPYAAPEQLRCEYTDARTDIWGFGTVLYEMATSQRPFSEEVARV